MTALIFDPFDEFQKFLSNLSFDNLLANPTYIIASKKLHKRVLALLIVEHQFNIEMLEVNSVIYKTSITYLNEFKSDLLSSLLIFHLGLYKTTMMTARSALENLLRVIAGAQNLDFHACKSVFELIDLVKNSPLRKTNSSFETALLDLTAKYGEYCNYVHSTGEEFLSLDRKLSDMPRWIMRPGKQCSDSLVKMIQSAICVLIILKPPLLHKLHHTHKDTVLDALPKRMKSGFQ